jgi:hypothetical protein
MSTRSAQLHGRDQKDKRRKNIGGNENAGRDLRERSSPRLA